ncbi:hypothetical protein [Streptomyces sp. NPDC025273]
MIRPDNHVGLVAGADDTPAVLGYPAGPDRARPADRMGVACMVDGARKG